MVVLSSLAAAVQGMDEAVINGAQIIYPSQFGIGGSSSKYVTYSAWSVERDSYNNQIVTRSLSVLSTRLLTCKTLAPF